MTSFSHNTFERAIYETFDQRCDQTFENLINDHGDQEDEMKTRKNEFLSNEIVKKAISGYGMIISVTLQHILKIFSDEDLE